MSLTPEQQARFDEDQRRLEKLSSRERQVFDLLMQGLSSTLISERLNITAKTVHTYKSGAQFKLQCPTDIDLFKLGIRHGCTDVWAEPQPMHNTVVWGQKTKAAEFVARREQERKSEQPVQ